MDKNSLIGLRFLAPINQCDYVEGEVTDFNEETGSVKIMTNEGELFTGYEYQLEELHSIEN